MHYLRNLIIIVCCGIGASVLGGWGFLVHRTVNQTAIYQLPLPLREFYMANMEYIVKESIRPDNRRKKNSSEAPLHFINLEAFGDSAAWKLPVGWKQALRQFPRDSFEKYGLLPYQILLLKDDLTRAFRKRNKDSILFFSADISHYLADAQSPLHTTLNCDGQLTDQKGLHSLWESMIPEMELTKYQLYSAHKAIYLTDPSQTTWQSIRRSYILVEKMIRIEKETSIGFTSSTKYRIQIRRGVESRSYSSAFARAYSAKLKTMVNDQLLYSSNLIADFWYTCWVDGGKPDLKELINDSATQRDQWKIQMEAYQQNMLIKKGLLLSRRNQ